RMTILTSVEEACVEHARTTSNDVFTIFPSHPYTTEYSITGWDFNMWHLSLESTWFNTHFIYLIGYSGGYDFIRTSRKSLTSICIVVPCFPKLNNFSSFQFDFFNFLSK